MTQYKYICADLVTDEVIAEVPFFGVNLNKIISSGADGTFSINLDNGILPNIDTLAATEPWHIVVYPDKDGELLGGWFITSRTYQSQAKVLSLTARTLESVADIRDIATRFSKVNLEQRNIFCQLWEAMQAEDAYSNYGIELPTDYPYSDQVMQTSIVETWDYKVYGDEMRALADTDTGFDWTIDVFYTGTDIRKKLRTGYPHLGQPLGDSSPIFEYPGAIRNYYWPESIIGTGTHVTGIGAGEGASMLTHTEIDQIRLDAGYARMDLHVPFKGEQTLDRLAARTRAEALKDTIPKSIPTIQVAGDQIGQFGLGDMSKLIIKDCRFPGGLNAARRVVGWSITPPASDSVEEARVIFEGGDV
jgi:hypothetical protein